MDITLVEPPYQSQIKNINMKIMINFTKQLGNNDPYSNVIVINFTPKISFLKP